HRPAADGALAGEPASGRGGTEQGVLRHRGPSMGDALPRVMERAPVPPETPSEIPRSHPGRAYDRAPLRDGDPWHPSPPCSTSVTASPRPVGGGGSACRSPVRRLA